MSRRPEPKRLVFETHATSLDNEAGLASGHVDVDLSPLGERQALALGVRYSSNPPARVLTSDLQRAWRTAELAFGGRVPILRDARLRECDYGDLTRRPSASLDLVRLAAIDTPFTRGESYTQVTARVAASLEDLRGTWPGGWVLLIGHRATHYALDHLLRGWPLAAAMAVPFVWQPGWEYELDGCAGAHSPTRPG